jgi:hypothetical protein
MVLCMTRRTGRSLGILDELNQTDLTPTNGEDLTLRVRLRLRLERRILPEAEALLRFDLIEEAEVGADFGDGLAALEDALFGDRA